MLSLEKEKDLEFLLCFLQIKEKGMHDLEFLFCFPQKNEKGMHQTEFVFCFLQKKAKGMRMFLNSAFLFAPICHTSLIFHFLVGQSTMKSAEILLLKN